jgi:cytochrome c oxidase cbb3-type subunit 3
MHDSARRLVATFLVLAALGAGAASIMAAGAHGRRDAIMRADPETILSRPDLAATALADGKAGFAAHCAACHGADGKPDRLRDTPDLTDRDTLYSPGVASTEQIVLHGIRSSDPRGWNLAAMPAYATPRPYGREPIAPLSPAGIRDVTQFVLSLGGHATDTEAVGRGAVIFRGRGGCYDCHADDGAGDQAIGAPDLTDGVWLYGDGSPDSIARSIANGHAGICPAFGRMLTPFEARAIAVYVVSLSSPAKAGADHE